MARTISLVLVATLMMTMSLSGCGRKGPLEAPSLATATEKSEKPAPVEDKPFILDGLIK